MALPTAAPVANASMTIVLPTAIDPGHERLDDKGSVNPRDHTTDGKVWTWTAHTLNAGDSFEVRLQFPPLVTANAPSWQAADDAARQAQETHDQHQALINAIFLAVALLVGSLGAIGLYALWYFRGRDPHVGLVAQFLPQPPDDLPAGAVGVLVDEVADERDVVATLVDLARRGVIKLDEVAGVKGGATTLI